MGAIKAGVSVVAFYEKESLDALNDTLKNSHCKGLLFSPSTEIEAEEGATRESFLRKLVPDLEKLYPGDPLQLEAYPHLK